MKKVSKLIVSGLVAVTFGGAVLSSNASDVSAKVRSAKVLGYNGLSKTAYNVNGGYLYSNAKLTKKVHNAKSFLNTTFYATKSATVRRTNGSRATYYYIANGSKSVRGWIWQGNLSKAKSYAKQKADIKAMMAIVRTMNPSSQDDILADFKDMSPKEAYNAGDGQNNDLSSVVSDIGYAAWQDDAAPSDIQAVGQAYNLFSGRFSSMTNSKLATLYDRFKQAQDTDGVPDAAHNLADTLADAVATLQ